MTESDLDYPVYALQFYCSQSFGFERT